MTKDIGKRIKEIRTRRGMTQEELGAALGGIGKAAVQKLESGRSCVSIEKLVLLCRIFNVFPTNLLYGSFPSLWDNVYGIKVPGGKEALKSMELIARLDALCEARFGPSGIVLLKAVSELNDEGVARALAYASDLCKIDEYRKESERPD